MNAGAVNVRSPGLSGWYLVVVVVLLILLSYIDRGVLTLLGNSVQTHFSINDSQMALLYGLAFILPLGLATVVVGWAVDRYNRVTIILTGLIIWSFSTAACGLADSYTTLLLARGGVGLGEAALAPAAYSLIADHFPANRRGRAMGIVTAAVSVGAGAALVVGGALLRLLGPNDLLLPYLGTVANWQAVFLLLGLAGGPLTMLVLTLRETRTPAPATRAHQTATAPVSDWSFVTKYRTLFVVVFCAGALNVAVGTGVMTWTPSLLLRQFSLPHSEAGYMLGIMMMIGGLLGAPLAAELSDRWIACDTVGGRLRGHPPFFACLIAGTAILALSPNPYLAASGVLLVGLALGAINSLSYASIQDLAPTAIRGQLLAALQFITLACGYGLGPSLVAFFSDKVFAGSSALAWAFLCVATPLCLAGIIAALLVRRHYLPALREASNA